MTTRGATNCLRRLLRGLRARPLWPVVVAIGLAVLALQISGVWSCAIQAAQLNLLTAQLVEATATRDRAHIERLIAQAQRLVEANPNCRPCAERVWAVAAAATGELPAAQIVLDRHLTRCGDDRIAIWQFASANWESGNRPLASALLRRAGLAREFVRPMFEMGIALGRGGEWSEAERRLRDVTEADPTFGEAHYYLAGLYEAHGDTDRAAASYQAAAESLSSDPLLRALALSRVGVLARDWPLAIESLERAVRLSGGAETYLLLGQVYVDSGMSRRALEPLETARRIDHTLDAIVSYHLGRAYELLDCPRQGAEEFARAARAPELSAQVRTLAAEGEARLTARWDSDGPCAD